MTEQELVESINKTIIGLELHFVADGCEGQEAPLCMSCQAALVIEDLKEMAELLND